jgi:twitching motility protein PilU
MEHALAFAETGHLAISTLHANNANQALDRIVNLFPEERRPQLLMNLGQNLRAFVSQRLVRTVDEKRCAAVEVLLGTKTIEELIIKGEFESIKEIMAKSEGLGMQTFDAALFKLFKEGRISMDEAIRNADSQNDIRLRIKLDQSGGDLSIDSNQDKTHTTASGLTLSLVEEEKDEDDDEDQRH